jgi:5-hydroxyisourate hydrolase
MSQITTHVLNTALGAPAKGVPVLLEQMEPSKQWKELSRKKTNSDGRVTDLLPEGKLAKGTYRLTFDTKSYFDEIDEKSFYAFVSVVFQIEDTKQHYHVPLLISPFGYSTYRGS